jgi:hypothetical protein
MRGSKHGILPRGATEGEVDIVDIARTRITLTQNISGRRQRISQRLRHGDPVAYLAILPDRWRASIGTQDLFFAVSHRPRVRAFSNGFSSLWFLEYVWGEPDLGVGITSGPVLA